MTLRLSCYAKQWPENRAPDARVLLTVNGQPYQLGSLSLWLEVSAPLYLRAINFDFGASASLALALVYDQPAPVDHTVQASLKWGRTRWQHMTSRAFVAKGTTGNIDIMARHPAGDCATCGHAANRHDAFGRAGCVGQPRANEPRRCLAPRCLCRGYTSAARSAAIVSYDTKGDE